MLNLDENLAPLYEAAASDPELSWITEGSGRMLRSPTVFEDVVKTICTTNCTWSATVRMVTALVEHLGEESVGKHAPPAELPDEDVAARLLSLPGVGPYAAAHVMMLLGRHSRLILDSWTRPKYASLNGRKASDRQIERRFARYGTYAGLAFWLFLTRDWVEDS